MKKVLGDPFSRYCLLNEEGEVIKEGRIQRRERAYYSHRAFTTCAVSSWESEELDERPHALSLGSC